MKSWLDLKDIFPLDYLSKDYLQLCLRLGKKMHANWTYHGVVNLVIIDHEIFLIQRSYGMPSHKGHIALVGGHKQGSETVLETAYREFTEETGININELQTLGLSSFVWAAQNTIILPAVHYYQKTRTEFLDQLASNGEWDKAFMVPIAYFQDHSNWSYCHHHGALGMAPVYFCPIWPQFKVVGESHNTPVLLWGATARIIKDFVTLLSPS